MASAAWSVVTWLVSSASLALLAAAASRAAFAESWAVLSSSFVEASSAWTALSSELVASAPAISPFSSSRRRSKSAFWLASFVSSRVT